MTNENEPITAPETSPLSEDDLAAVRAEFPDFDLTAELADPRFAHLISPAVGLSATEAYYLTHRAEIRRQDALNAASTATERLTAALLSGARRPAEAGASGRQNPPTTTDWRTASAADRRSLKARIRAAAARGEKVYPGR